VFHVLASCWQSGVCCSWLACVVVFRALGRPSRLARVVVSRCFLLHAARGSSQPGFRRKRFVLSTQAASCAPLPGIQSSVIVQVTDGVACCRLTSHSRRTASPPLNSSVRRQSIFLRSASRVSLPGFVLAERRFLFLAGLRCCLSRAWSSVASGARCRISLVLAARCARFVATWPSSSAVRSSHAGRKLRGIAEYSEQRYRASHRRRSVLPSNKSFKADGFAAA
jgi:hypothetical protein